MATENELIEEMVSILREKMDKDYDKGSTKRDAHPKSLGLLKANFRVLDSIPESLKHGVFKTAKTFSSWIRVSNASGTVQPDTKKDFRGFAIKLLGVEGERFRNDEVHTQDFLFMSHPVMPLGTVKLFRDVIYYSIKWNRLILAIKFFLSGKMGILNVLKNGSHHDTSPLDIHYWSTTPYRLNDLSVKYKIVPTSSVKSQLPKPLTDNYLSHNMREHLKQSVATFDFYIQVFKDERSTPIEDAGVEWLEKDSPFIKVAELEIPVQDIDTDNRLTLAEQFSFSPANALLIHKPIGGVNRARSIIYQTLSAYRHKRDGVDLLEPSLDDYHEQ